MIDARSIKQHRRTFGGFLPQGRTAAFRLLELPGFCAVARSDREHAVFKNTNGVFCSNDNSFSVSFTFRLMLFGFIPTGARQPTDVSHGIEFAVAESNNLNADIDLLAVTVHLADVFTLDWEVRIRFFRIERSRFFGRKS